MADRDRVLEELRLAGSAGVHSLDLRRRGLTGNPSQRVAELRKLGYRIVAQRERTGGRQGTRYRLIQGTGGGGTSSSGAQGGLPPAPASAAASGVGAHRRDAAEEGVQEQESGSLFELESPKPRNPFIHGDLDEAA